MLNSEKISGGTSTYKRMPECHKQLCKMRTKQEKMKKTKRKWYAGKVGGAL